MGKGSPTMAGAHHSAQCLPNRRTLDLMIYGVLDDPHAGLAVLRIWESPHWHVQVVRSGHG